MNGHRIPNVLNLVVMVQCLEDGLVQILLQNTVVNNVKELSNKQLNVKSKNAQVISYSFILFFCFNLKFLSGIDIFHKYLWIDKVNTFPFSNTRKLYKNYDYKILKVQLSEMI